MRLRSSSVKMTTQWCVILRQKFHHLHVVHHSQSLSVIMSPECKSFLPEKYKNINEAIQHLFVLPGLFVGSCVYIIITCIQINVFCNILNSNINLQHLSFNANLNVYFSYINWIVSKNFRTNVTMNACSIHNQYKCYSQKLIGYISIRVSSLFCKIILNRHIYCTVTWLFLKWPIILRMCRTWSGTRDWSGTDPPRSLHVDTGSPETGKQGTWELMKKWVEFIKTRLYRTNQYTVRNSTVCGVLLCMKGRGLNTECRLNVTR